MNIGMVGLGKLGLPVATAMAARGLDVYGHDPHVTGYPEDTSHEDGFAEAIEAAGDRLRFTDLSTVVEQCDVVFVAVQTPHEPRFEGTTPLPEDRADFDYTHLKQAIEQIADAAARQDRLPTVAVISTVLPGTMAREIQPWLGLPLVYNPSFIAMGTTIRDFLDPEFVLLGGDDGTVQRVYNLIHRWPPRFVKTTVENAELIKVAYNTFIGLKIAFANTLMEVCHKTGCDVDEVTGALKQADRRLISGAYLDGGMGDGGGCHPRDNIALSWLARELRLSYDLFHCAMEAREFQTGFLCREVISHCDGTLDPAILGIAYKPGSHITTGSPALLAKDLLESEGYTVPCWDPHVGVVGPTAEPEQPYVFLVGCKHPEFPGLKLPEGSIVIDPFRYMPDREGVEVIRIGQWEQGRTATSRSTTPPLAA